MRDNCISVISGSVETTEETGFRIGECLFPGSVLLLEGDLGAGKTAFTRGICSAFAVAEQVHSPTFALLNVYHGVLPVYHFDLYRIGTTEELSELGFEDYFYGDGITIIEWPRIAEELFPDAALRIRISYGCQECERKITVTCPQDSRYQEVLERIAR